MNISSDSLATRAASIHTIAVVNELPTLPSGPAIPLKAPKIDVEHLSVKDDPRKWTKARKNVILAIIATAAMINTFATNIFTPALTQFQADLHASDIEMSTSLSIFIVVQGISPLFWSALSEIKGRKFVYLTSEPIFIIGSIIVAFSKGINLVIIMRCLQAFGSAAVSSIGSGTLADIYEPHERGAKMGIYYAAPLIGPSLGPVIGGALTQTWDWRATFYFLAAFCTLSLASFFLFKDTFRKERSLVYLNALAKAEAKADSIGIGQTGNTKTHGNESQTTIVVADKESISSSEEKDKDVEAQVEIEDAEIKSNGKKAMTVHDVKLSFWDVNPLAPLPSILKRRTNLIVLVSNGMFYGFTFSILFTSSLTLSEKYHFNDFHVGLFMLAFGAGNMLGSIIGGRWSDYVFVKSKEKNGGKGYPELRLESTKYALIILPLSSLAYAWLCEKKAHIALVCVALFISGFFSIIIYSSTLAYLIDSNNGRSTTAAACNSTFRGVCAFISSEVAVPIQDSLGDGGLYSIWAGLCIFAGLLIVLLLWKGKQWREEDEVIMSGSGSVSGSGSGAGSGQEASEDQKGGSDKSMDMTTPTTGITKPTTISH